MIRRPAVLISTLVAISGCVEAPVVVRPAPPPGPEAFEVTIQCAGNSNAMATVAAAIYSEGNREKLTDLLLPSTCPMPRPQTFVLPAELLGPGKKLLKVKYEVRDRREWYRMVLSVAVKHKGQKEALPTCYQEIEHPGWIDSDIGCTLNVAKGRPEAPAAQAMR